MRLLDHTTQVARQHSLAIQIPEQQTQHAASISRTRPAHFLAELRDEPAQDRRREMSQIGESDGCKISGKLSEVVRVVKDGCLLEPSLLPQVEEEFRRPLLKGVLRFDRSPRP